MDADETGPPGNGMGQAAGLTHCAREESTGEKVAPPTLASQARDRTNAESFYEASPIKRKRRSAAEIKELFNAVLRILNEYREPITIRHLFYRLAGIGVIAKDEKSYDRLVSCLGKWRINGRIPFNRFVDGTRWHYGVDTFDDE